MIRKLLTPLDELISGKSYVDVYGGLAQQAVSIEEIGEGLFSETIFPVSMNVDGQACLDGKYSDLIPDSSKRSIFYFEGLGDMDFREPEGRRSAQARNEGRIAIADYRLVGWLNLPLLGENSPVSHKVVCDLLGSIHGYSIIDPQSIDLSAVSQIRYKVIRQVNRDVKIFERYSYGDKMNLLLSPYDFFALIIQVQAIMKGGTCCTYEPGEELSCF